MSRMPPSVIVSVALAVILGLEALGLLGYFAATASQRGVESAGVFIGGVLFMIHAGHFVAGAVHRRASARAGAIKKAFPIAVAAALILAVGATLEEDPIPRPLVVAIAAGFVAPLTAAGLLLLGRGARRWFDRPGAAT